MHAHVYVNIFSSHTSKWIFCWNMMEMIYSLKGRVHLKTKERKSFLNFKLKNQKIYLWPNKMRNTYIGPSGSCYESDHTQTIWRMFWFLGREAEYSPLQAPSREKCDPFHLFYRLHVDITTISWSMNPYIYNEQSGIYIYELNDNLHVIIKSGAWMHLIVELRGSG